MGYYENPPIINPSEGYNAITVGILSGSKAIAEGLMLRGERRREREKEDRLTIQKLQDQKNKTDLLYNEKLSDWTKKHDKVGYGVDEQVTALLQDKIQKAADAQIALSQESDSTKRKEYLKLIRDADGFMESASTFSKNLAMESATWREGSPGVAVGVAGGWAINGTPEQIKQRKAALEIVGGLDGEYENPNMTVEEDGTGSGFNVIIKGRVKGDAADFAPVVINSASYLKADAEGAGGFLSKVEGLDDFMKTSQKEVVDKNGKLIQGFLSQKPETVDLPSQSGSSGRGVKDVYQITEGQRLDDTAIKERIKKAADIKASGYLKADKSQSLRALLDYTLGKEPGYYDDVFSKLITVDEKKKVLSDLLTESSFNNITNDLHKTTENGKTVYWGPDSKVTTKEKPTLSSLEGDKPGKQPPTTYQEDYFNEIISGYTPKEGENISAGQRNYATRSTLAKNLNKLSGKADKYITKEELFKLYKTQPFVKETSRGPVNTDMTIEEAYQKGKVEGDINKAFTSRFGNSYLYGKEGDGAYKAVKDYNIDKATDRIKLALDQTSDTGERKLLQGKLKDAKLKDWVDANPRKNNETTEQYYARANKSN